MNQDRKYQDRKYQDIKFSSREDFSELIKISVISIDFSHEEHKFAIATLEIYDIQNQVYPLFLQIGTFFRGRFLTKIKNKNTNIVSIIYIASPKENLLYMKNISDNTILLCHSFTNKIYFPSSYEFQTHEKIKILEVTENKNDQIPYMIKIKKNIKNETIQEIQGKYSLKINYGNYDADKSMIDQFISAIKGKINILSQGNRDKEMHYIINFTIQPRIIKQTTFFQIILNENGMGKRDFPDFCRNEQILNEKLQRMVNIETIKIKIILDSSIHLYDTIKYKEKIYKIISIQHHISKLKNYTIIEAVFERRFSLENLDQSFDEPEITTNLFLSFDGEDILLNPNISTTMLKDIKIHNPITQEKQNHFSISKLIVF